MFSRWSGQNSRIDVHMHDEHMIAFGVGERREQQQVREIRTPKGQGRLDMLAIADVWESWSLVVLANSMLKARYHAVSGGHFVTSAV